MSEKEVREFKIWKPILDHEGVLLPAPSESEPETFQDVSKARAVNQALIAWGIKGKFEMRQYRREIRCELVKKVRPKKAVQFMCEMCHTPIDREIFGEHQPVCEALGDRS